MGSDEGSGTVMVVGVLAAFAVLACSALAYIAILAAGNRAQNIADLSALAGADVSATAQWESVEEKACRAANEVAQEKWSNAERMSLRKRRHDRHGACEQWVGMECLSLGSSGS